MGPMPDTSYYGVDQMRDSERNEFLSWYETKRHVLFDNRRTLEQYCQADVTVLREACQTFRKHFLQIGNVEVFLECMTIASACNSVFRKRFLQPERIGIIPTGGYTNTKKQSKKASEPHTSLGLRRLIPRLRRRDARRRWDMAAH